MITGVVTVTLAALARLVSIIRLPLRRLVPRVRALRLVIRMDRRTSLPHLGLLQCRSNIDNNSSSSSNKIKQYHQADRMEHLEQEEGTTKARTHATAMLLLLDPSESTPESPARLGRRSNHPNPRQRQTIRMDRCDKACCTTQTTTMMKMTMTQTDTTIATFSLGVSPWMPTAGEAMPVPAVLPLKIRIWSHQQRRHHRRSAIGWTRRYGSSRNSDDES